MTTTSLTQPDGRHRRRDGAAALSVFPGAVAAGRYEFFAPLDRGAEGRVWRARDRRLDRDVAVKVYDEQTPSDDALVDAFARCVEEARAAAGVHSDGVVNVHDVVEHGRRPCLVMDLVPGRNLARVLADGGALPARTVAALGVHLVAALQAVHASGVVHRDVKPSNIILAAGGRPVLVDFGVAAVPGAQATEPAGTVVGSPAYLAPEAVLGAPPDPAADLWSLGATLYAAVEGRPPSPVTDPVAGLIAVLRDDPLPPRAAGPLRPVLERLLVKDPARRAAADAAAAAMLLHVVRG
jgi:serine/threonine protein kinase